MCPDSVLWTALNWPKIQKMTMTSKFYDMTSMSDFFDVVLFLLSSLVTGQSFMLIASLVLELWQFSFTRDSSEIRKSEIPTSQFCLRSADWGELWLPNLARMSLIVRVKFLLGLTSMNLTFTLLMISQIQTTSAEHQYVHG